MVGRVYEWWEVVHIKRLVGRQFFSGNKKASGGDSSCPNQVDHRKIRMRMIFKKGKLLAAFPKERCFFFRRAVDLKQMILIVWIFKIKNSVCFR